MKIELHEKLDANSLITLCEQGLSEAKSYYLAVIECLKPLVYENQKVSPKRIEIHQTLCHGAAWISTYVTALEQLLNWARDLSKTGQFSRFEQLILQIGYGEYLSQLKGGVPLSQGEMIRPAGFGLTGNLFEKSAELLTTGNTDAARKSLVELMPAYAGTSHYGNAGLEDEYRQISHQFRRFADEQIVPYAHEWHLKNELIPLDTIQQLADLGVFGLTIPEEYGGFGMGKLAMCVVTEELARGYIGVGSLGTRAEIAGELVLCGGTEAQKQHWLPKIARGECLPTAVFTEPDTGSDLGSLKTRAVKNGEEYVITGNKTWITHAVRSDVMTLLVRTNAETSNHTGLSLFMAEKPRGTDENPFPAQGMNGSEIEVLGYRGMREYELGFDGFRVKAANLLGGQEGAGFTQLMKTFEGARIQTAARAVGVAQSAMELGYTYANERKQFGKALINFPRIYSKLAMMVVEIMIARQLTYYSANEKDNGKRCDLEAGMAKLLGARVAWACADNGLQIHGGNGFATEYPISRVLCDARILNIFEGAAEIQATVIIRRLLND